MILQYKQEGGITMNEINMILEEEKNNNSRYSIYYLKINNLLKKRKGNK